MTLAILIPTGVAISSFVMVTSLEIQPSGARTGVKPAALVAARTWRSAASSGTGSTSTSIMNTAIYFAGWSSPPGLRGWKGCNNAARNR